MMEVVSPSIDENRLPPIVVNGHCKLKQNGIIKCQETGMTEPEMCRRPSPEGEESRDISENDQVPSLEKEILDDEPQKKDEEKTEELKEVDEREKETEELVVEEEIEKKTVSEAEEIKEELESSEIAEEISTKSENDNDEKVNVSESEKDLMNEIPVVPEIEITTCGENKIDDDEEEEVEEEQKDEYVESVLDREIRLQQEREESLAKERETVKMELGISEQPTEPPPKPIAIHQPMQPTERPYCNQTTESRIALEIREMREREEELKRMRENIKVQTVEAPESKEIITPVEKEQAVVVEKKPPVSETVIANLGIFKKRDRVKVRPLEDVEDEESPIYRMNKESPIEREIRLLKEREEELRREKGLAAPLKKSEAPTKVIRERSVAQPPVQTGDTQRLLATNRIQQEIEEQTRRELDLRETGHIRTLSRDTDERPINVSVCKSARFINGTGKENMSNGIKKDDSTESKSSEKSEKKNKVDARFPLINRRNVSAESKIQQELQEMKAREEELRQQRLKITDQSEQNTPVLVNGNENSLECITGHLNPKDQNKMVNNDVPTSGRRRRSALIAQWEQRIQNAEGKS